MEYFKDIQELGVSERCAADVFYLRTRSRWTEELEKELILLHKNGNPPNMCDFGVTEETQAKMAKLCEEIAKKYKE